MRKKQSRKSRRRTLKQALLTGDIKFAGHVEVVGGFYHQMWDAKVDGHLVEGSWLMLRREIGNFHDSNAIKVLTSDGKIPVGYIAKEEAQRLAPFMDVGVRIAARALSYTNSPMRMVARLYVSKGRR